MPTLELVQYTPQNNAELLDMLRGEMDPVYQSRVPAATRAGLDATMNAIANYSPAANQVVDALINLIGAQEIKYQTFTNPLAKYKVGMLNKGETIQEVALGLIKAKAYSTDELPGEQELFGREKTEVQSVYHTVNRRDRYKITIQEDILDQAFLSEGGLSKFIIGLMSQINTSDNFDEFLMTANTLTRYHDKGGFYKVNVPDLHDPNVSGDGVRLFLEEVRTMSDTLPWLSRRYNSRHVPMVTEQGDLELITTPRAKAKMDVQALAAAFNIAKAEVGARMTVIPEEYWPIKGGQAILTSRRFWTIADKLMAMRQLQNPAGLYNNYWWHHQEVVSASPFENAILFTSEEGDTISIVDYTITGLTAYTLTDNADGSVVTVTNGAATVQRGHSYMVGILATTDPVGGPNNAVTLTLEGKKVSQTYINQIGILNVSYWEKATTLIVHGKATDDNTFEADLTLTVTGTLIEGGIALEVDDDPGTINNTRKPGITPAAGGPVGTVLKADHGSWDTDDLAWTYVWKRDGVAISGAPNSNEYTSVTADGGHAITMTLTGSKAGLTAGTATTNPVNITA